MPVTVPSPDLLNTKTNKVGTTYDAAATTKWWAEEYAAIYGRLVSGVYSVNAIDLWLGGTETITSNRDFVGRQIACSGVVGSKPWADGAISGLFYYAGKQAFRVGTVTGTEWNDANIGTSSFAVGYDAQASGIYSVAMGQYVTAGGDTSVALGYALDTGSFAAALVGFGVSDADRLDALDDYTVSFAAGSDIPSITIKTVTPGVGAIGLVGIGLGATLPTLAYLQVKASTTSYASLSMAHGTAPTAPNNGDVWTTTAGVYARINGATVGPLIDASGAVPAFSAITNGTNTAAAMLVGTGASLGVTGSGTIDPVMSASHVLSWTGRSEIASSADGYIELTDAAGTAFTGLRFGGTSSSFPMLKRSSGNLEIKLADDSNYTYALALGYIASNSGAALFGTSLALSNACPISFGGSSSYGSTRDLYLARNAAKVLTLTEDNASAGAALEGFEMTAPGNPGTGGFRFYAIDNGGKTEILCKFDDGSTAQVCIQP